jgi:hypothetical protein
LSALFVELFELSELLVLSTELSALFVELFELSELLVLSTELSALFVELFELSELLVLSTELSALFVELFELSALLVVLKLASENSFAWAPPFPPWELLAVAVEAPPLPSASVTLGFAHTPAEAVIIRPMLAAKSVLLNFSMVFTP